MYQAVLLPHVKHDIQEAANWYNNKQTGLGVRFTQEIRHKVKFISRNPKTIAIRYDDVRCAVLSQFPFIIHFHIDESKKQIIITAIFHTSLNPSRWKKTT